MKLCPICKSSIIPDSWQYCYLCEHKIDPTKSVFNGGFPSGGVGRMVAHNGVALVIRNEVAVCDNQKGLAIYDLEEQNNVGVLYQKADDGKYKCWYGINYVDCKSFGINGKPLEKIVRLDRGTYDVEAVFFNKYRKIFGDNRKVMVGGIYENIEDFNTIRENVLLKGSYKYIFYCLQVGRMNERLLTARRNYRKIPLGAISINESGELSVYEDNPDFYTHYLSDLICGGSTECIEYNGYKLIRGIDVCRNRHKAYEMYCGEICYDLQLNRHVVLVSSKLGSIMDDLKQCITNKILLANPIFLEDSEYRGVSDAAIARIKNIM